MYAKIQLMRNRQRILLIIERPRRPMRGRTCIHLLCDYGQPYRPGRSSH